MKAERFLAMDGDPVTVARRLLGQRLVRVFDGKIPIEILLQSKRSGKGASAVTGHCMLPPCWSILSNEIALNVGVSFAISSSWRLIVSWVGTKP